MFSLNSDYRYYLYAPACDMRKSFDGLSGLVVNALGREPTDGSVYVFLNRRRTHLKLLHWESGGLASLNLGSALRFVLYYKRLETGCFSVPEKQMFTWADLVLMVEGIVVKRSIQQPRYSLIKA